MLSLSTLALKDLMSPDRPLSQAQTMLLKQVRSTSTSIAWLAATAQLHRVQANGDTISFFSTTDLNVTDDAAFKLLVHAFECVLWTML
ncbi:hypothetical protein [Leptolyngbya sp. 'hensonii']|uniref:hypothetical protein n=1 Tax=Leptolyngbya sp. 'hensonii' TaxID=1922337 RepID=UPI000A48C895|nr:hypothetical protein [Leptolyngbya sp. 'hensonii']